MAIFLDFTNDLIFTSQPIIILKLSIKAVLLYLCIIMIVTDSAWERAHLA